MMIGWECLLASLSRHRRTVASPSIRILDRTHVCRTSSAKSDTRAILAARSFRGARVILLGLFLLLGWTTHSRAELAHGTVDLREGGLDFSELQLVEFGSPAADLGLIYVVDPPLGYRFWTGWNGSFIMTADSTLEEITAAPEDDALYDQDAVPVVGQAYIVKASDGFYAKFALREFSRDVLIEYYVQLDGTNVLIDAVPLQQTTWGRIKALYD